MVIICLPLVYNQRPTLANLSLGVNPPPPQFESQQKILDE